jgi:hypothetical protein
VDAGFYICKNNLKYYHVISVGHFNMFVPLEKQDFEHLTKEHVNDMAAKHLADNKMTTGDESHKLPEAAKNMENKINENLGKTGYAAPGLDEYDSAAFIMDDDFDFAHGNAGDINMDSKMHYDMGETHMSADAHHHHANGHKHHHRHHHDDASNVAREHTEGRAFEKF